jgi:hypothetical protein
MRGPLPQQSRIARTVSASGTTTTTTTTRTTVLYRERRRRVGSAFGGWDSNEFLHTRGLCNAGRSVWEPVTFLQSSQHVVVRTHSKTESETEVAQFTWRVADTVQHIQSLAIGGGECW